ncbi:hypothetical protein [Cohnella thailandensis]|uniref:GNAT family N-acetyltransferase n=1 Tax=Cohnella thailandensis TaxID=557557 RepID=A0A841SWB7_9BACL|nr:hypothetical protein [Cohnella thailandensis]MBB6635259.1 hypothetical protein [Cohnella thailandensis]MBP1974631.1 hypothetical protein [Cohnella thailandensis]
MYRRCDKEPDHAAYTKFLIRHQNELNLPYSFPVKLSFIAAPLLYGQALLILEEESYEIAGAAGFVLGTGANEYEDTNVCQIEVAFLREGYRSSTLFARALRVLLESIRVMNPAVETVQFWAPADLDSAKRLYTRWRGLPGSSVRIEGSLALYSVSFEELDRFSRCYRRERITTGYAD